MHIAGTWLSYIQDPAFIDSRFQYLVYPHTWLLNRASVYVEEASRVSNQCYIGHNIYSDEHISTTTTATIVNIALARSPGQALIAFQLWTCHAQNRRSCSTKCNVAVAILGRVCQISVDHCCSINDNAASCCNWVTVSTNLPRSELQTSKYGDLVWSREHARSPSFSKIHNWTLDIASVHQEKRLHVEARLSVALGRLRKSVRICSGGHLLCEFTFVPVSEMCYLWYCEYADVFCWRLSSLAVGSVYSVQSVLVNRIIILI